ncbi:MAG TPA: alpha/beta hydrolase [Vicinamibacterales bacterium]|nr:alpha/beta hydrolase [Vicinamibacterales bacterium]
MVAMIVLIVATVVLLVWGVRQLEPRMAFFPFSGEDVTPRQFGVDFVGHTLDTADGERLRAWHIPRADAVAQVVYFHGNGGNLSIWADVLVGLWRERLDVVAVDYRGYGVSSGTPTEQGLYRDVDATIAYVDAELRRGDLPLIYWGRSLGTAMAGYAATRGRPDAIVLEAGFPSVRSLFDRNPVMLVLSAFSTYRFATAEWMAGVTTPTLVIHGDRDSVIPYRLGQRLYETLPGPKRFVTIPGGDHNDPAPADAPLYWGAVREFIASLDRRSFHLR